MMNLVHKERRGKEIFIHSKKKKERKERKKVCPCLGTDIGIKCEDKFNLVRILMKSEDVELLGSEDENSG